MLGHSTNGIEIQTYVGIIACLLITLWAGRKPIPRTCEMIYVDRPAYVVVRLVPESSSSRVRKKAVINVLDKLWLVASIPVSKAERTLGSQPPS